MHPTDTATASEPQLFSFWRRCRVQQAVSGLPSTLLVVALLGAGCGRSPLFQREPRPTGGLDAAVLLDAPADLASDPVEEPRPELPPDLPPDLTPDLPPDLAPDLPADTVVTERPPACQPQAEVCNGRDDDCDGQTDEDLPAIPCPDGGNRYCVGGRYSECPRRCEVCVPGSRRICFVSFCTYWGSQACAADGRSFGACRESTAPQSCDQVVRDKKKSPELEQCCLDSGFCCLDEFDLDHDGDRTEMLGRCAAVECTP
jgi:hypothetical protein